MSLKRMKLAPPKGVGLGLGVEVDVAVGVGVCVGVEVAVTVEVGVGVGVFVHAAAIDVVVIAIRVAIVAGDGPQEVDTTNSTSNPMEACDFMSIHRLINSAIDCVASMPVL